MADLRRLSALVMIAILVVGCATTHTPRVTGRVVDKSTGRPVAGADVMVYRYARRFREHGSRHVNFGHRWQKTDAEGRFDFPAVLDRKPYRVGGLLWRLEDEPTVRVTDERYGTEAMVYREEFQRNPDKDAFLLAIDISENERHAICKLEEDKRVRFFCRGLYQPGAAHCIEIAKDMRCHEE